MSTPMRPELSEKNVYHLSRHRYYELKHFCQQYPEWKQEYYAITDICGLPVLSVREPNREERPVEQKAISREKYGQWMELVEEAAYLTEPELARYILKGVTEGLSYDVLRVQCGVPCCKDVYYRMYRRFFWILSEKRG